MVEDRKYALCSHKQAMLLLPTIFKWTFHKLVSKSVDFFSRDKQRQSNWLRKFSVEGKIAESGMPRDCDQTADSYTKANLSWLKEYFRREM